MTTFATPVIVQPLPALARLAITCFASATVLALAVFAAALSILIGLVAFKTRLADPATALDAAKVLIPAVLVGTALLHRQLWPRG